MNFKYDSTEDVKISVYCCAKQICNAAGVPMYFVIPPALPKATIETGDAGIGKEVKGSEQFKVDLKEYENQPLFSYSRDFFPIIITIEPRAAPTEKDGESNYQNIITYGMFNMNQESHNLEFKGLEQRLIANGDILVLQEIFGIEEGLADEAAEDEKMCVICLSAEKNTVVMPCGHLSVCKECATELARSRQPDCPICRKKVQSFVPLNISTIKNIEAEFKEEGSSEGVVEGEKI